MARLSHACVWKRRLCLLAAVCFHAALTLGQGTSEWRQFTAADGLGDSYVSSIAVSPRGEIVFTHHAPGPVTLYDGFDFRTTKLLPQGSGGREFSLDQPYRVLEDFPGSLWTIYGEGLAEWRDGTWLQHPIPEIAREVRTNFLRRVRANWVLPLGFRRVLFLTQNRLMGYDAERNETRTWKLASQTKLGVFSDLAAARDGGLWINGLSGLAKLPAPLDLLQPEAPWQEFAPDPKQALHNFQRAFPDDHGGVVMLAEQGPADRRVIVTFNGRDDWSVTDSPAKNARLAWAGLDGTYWAANVNALYHRENGQWSPAPVSKEEPQYLDVLVETNGVFWLGTSEGAFRYTPPPWRRPAGLPRDDGNAVLDIFEDGNSQIWTLQKDGLHREETNKWSFFGAPPGAPPPDAAQAYAMPNGTVVAGWNDKVFQLNPASRNYTELTEGDGLKRKVLGRLDAGRLCIGVSAAETAQHPWRFECFDGVSLRPCHELPDDLSIGKDVRFVFVAQDGDVWVGGSSFMALGRGGRWRVLTGSDEHAPEEASRMIQAGDGKIWVATRRQIFEFDGKSWSLVRGSFNRINGMSRSADGRVWVATESGLYREYKGEWAAISTEEGLASPEALCAFEDSNGRIWAGTRRGLSLYHPEADPDPPRTRVVAISADKHDLTEVVFVARDKWNVTPAGRLLFSWRRDNESWQPFSSLGQAQIVSYSGLDAGRHIFQVRGMDRNWNVERVVSKEFFITLPWYLDVRLLSFSAAAFLAALFFAGLALNRHLRLVRSYAEVERIVALRTEELEKANHKLLHSQKMNALGELAAGVAHDFNNILSIIKGSAQIIESNVNDPAKVGTRAARIKTVVDQGAAIVKAMLGFSRGSGKEMTLCDLNLLVDETLRLLGDRAIDQTRIEFEWAPGLPAVPGLKDYIQQILLNFLFNASDAMNGKGRVIIRAGEVKSLPSDLPLAPDEASHYVYISVRDFGVGVEPAIRSRIFEPFFTTKAFSARRGTGLGLSMAYEMARSMGYGLGLESEVGHGSTFTLFIPVRPLESAAAGARAEAPPLLP